MMSKHFNLKKIHLEMKKNKNKKGFRPPSAMMGFGYFQNLRNLLRNCLQIFWEFFESFWGIFWEEFFGRNFLGEIFLEDFLGRIFCEGFFERNSLVEIKKELMFLR